MSRQSPFEDELLGAFRDAGPIAEDQRRSMLRGRRILIVQAGYPGKRVYYERAHDLGMKLVVLDGPGHWSQELVRDGIAEQFIQLDLLPYDTAFDRALQAIRATGLHFDGVGTFWDLALPLAAQLAAPLGLPSHDTRAVALSRDKTLTRQACVAANIVSPRFARISTPADLGPAARQVGFSAILKPASGCCSIHAYRVEDEPALRQRYATIVDLVRGQLKTHGVTSDDALEMTWASGFEMVLEEYLDGQEFDVDCLLSEGTLVYAAVTGESPHTYCVEVGARMPPAFPADKQDELVELTARVLAGLGFSDGVFHVELKYTSAGPRLIEVNARLGGGRRHMMNQLVWGVDLAEQYLMTVIGLPTRPQKAARPLVYLAEADPPCPYSGIMARGDFLDAIADDPRVVFCRSAVQTGQRVVGPEDGVPDWLGEVLVRGDTLEAAGQALDELVGGLEIPIVPHDDYLQGRHPYDRIVGEKQRRASASAAQSAIRRPATATV